LNADTLAPHSIRKIKPNKSKKNQSNKLPERAKGEEEKKC